MMVINQVILLLLFGFIYCDDYVVKQRSLLIDSPTHWGTTECDYYPDIILQNYQPDSGRSYMLSFGITDIKPVNDITIIGLYYADTKSSQIQVIQQEKLGKALEKDGYIVNNIAINNYAPYSCAQESACGSTWWYSTWLPWTTDDCLDYIGGCKASDSRLEFDNWQKPFVDGIYIPVFQDREWEDAWDRFGGGQNDLFLYDKQGKLYKYICSVETCGKSTSIGSLSDVKAYDYIKALAIEAIRSNGTSRCANFKYPDYDKIFFADDIYYDDTFYHSHSWGDDEYYYYYDDDEYPFQQHHDIGERDVAKKRIHIMHHHKEHSVVSLSTYMSVIAVIVMMFTGLMLFYRYKSINRVNRGIIYASVSADDDLNDDDDDNDNDQLVTTRAKTKIERLSFPTYSVNPISKPNPSRTMAYV